VNTKGKSMNKSTGTAVRDIKGTTEKPPVPSPGQIQIHAGNTAVLTVQLLGQISSQLAKIVTALENKNG